MTSFTLFVMMPETVLAVFALILLIAGAVCGDRVARGINGFAIMAFLLSALCLMCASRGGHLDDMTNYAFDYAFVSSRFTTYIKLLLLSSSVLSLLLSYGYNERENLDRPEYPILMMLATLGMMLMVSASDMLALYVGLELQSLALYVLAAFRRDDARSSEAGLKYFVLGALSSGILLYGISLLYGYTGTTSFVDMAFGLQKMNTISIGVVVGVVFLCAGLAFKISAVPFHMWTPDVYEGAPTPITAYFASAPKLAAMALFARVLLLPMSGLAHQWLQIITFMAIASMLVGCFAGVLQTNIKRLMAYSSIANVGFMLVALAVIGKASGDSAIRFAGVQSLVIYLTIYALNTLGVFAVILCMQRQGKMVEKISDLSGFGKTNPLIALSMLIFMFSMAGVPPLAGFFGKYFVFLAAVQAHLIPLAIVGVLSSVVSAFYYLRIVKVMYFDDAKEPLEGVHGFGIQAVLIVTAAFMLLFTIWPSSLLNQAARAAHTIAGG